MKKKWSMKVGVSLLLTLCLGAEAFGILGLGDIVFDPTNYGEAVRQLLQMQQQYMQLVQSYQVLRSQYDQLLWMGKQVPVNMVARYRALATPWKDSSASNTYGTTGGWITGINTGQGVPVGYSQITEPLGTYGSSLADIPADQQDGIKRLYGTAELTDGANLSAIETIGRLRGNAPAVESAIQGLENDSLSADPEMNTEIAVLNKINAADLIAVRNTQDTNKLLVALAEQQLIDAKRSRDAEVQAINRHIRFMSEGKAVLTAQAAGASQAMLDWRMP